MLVTTLAVLHGQVADAEEEVCESLRVTVPLPDGPRGLLVTLVSIEDAAFHLAYTALVAYALALDSEGRPTGVDLLHPLTKLTPNEQVVVRTALVRQSWGAWARAPQHLRALLGRPDPPVLLADAARQLGTPLPTLANAAVGERLPTIRAGDRHLVYLVTVVEAQDRGLLHFQRGRPRRHP
ncbi:MAG: hypothetical protein HGA45_18945 [Chloroflexales bacterium]|nr:hypothetical protein [Chloroflexales bacterium]